MKIAVVLRGQPRSSPQAAHLFKKFILERVPSEYEFSFFIHTSKRVINLPVPDQSAPVLDKHYNQTSLTFDETLSRIQPWNPKYLYIEDEAPFFNVCKRIVEDLANDTYLHRWWDDHIKSNNISEEDRPGAGLIIPNLIDNRGHVYTKLYEPLVREGYYNFEGKLYDLNSIMSVIRFHYVFKQYYGFMQSYNVLKNYMTNEDTEYKPDLIWFTRLDEVHDLMDFENPDACAATFFNIMRDSMINCNEDGHPFRIGKYQAGGIASQNLIIERNHAWIDDYNLFSTVQLMERISHRRPEEFIIDAFKQYKHQLLNIIDARAALQHALWPAVFNDVVFMKHANSMNMLRSTILREGFHDRIDLMKLDNSSQSVKKFFDLDKTYSYPEQSCFRGPTPEEIVKEYIFLSNN